MMAQRVRTTSMRSPTSFETEVVTEVSQRVLIRMDKDGWPTIYETPTVTFQEFRDEIRTLGNVISEERYICFETQEDIARGIVEMKGVSVPYYVIVRQDEKVYRQDLIRVMSILQYTKVNNA